MAAITSHHDETRKGVGVTAHMCAYIRGLESAKSPADRLIFDPYASALAGEVAAEYISKKAGLIGQFFAFSSIGRSIISALSPIIGASANANFGMVDAMVRISIISLHYILSYMYIFREKKWLHVFMLMLTFILWYSQDCSYQAHRRGDKRCSFIT